MWKEHARNGQIYGLVLSVLQGCACHCCHLSPFCSHGDIRERAGPQYPWQSSEGDGEAGCICGGVNSGRVSEERGEAECPFLLQHKCALPLLPPRLCAPQCWILILHLVAQFSCHFGDWVIWVSISTRFMYVMQMALAFLLHGWIIFYSTCKAFCFSSVHFSVDLQVKSLSCSLWMMLQWAGEGGPSLTSALPSIRYRPRSGVWDPVVVLRNSYIIFFNGRTTLPVRGPFTPCLQHIPSLPFK